MSKDAIFHSSDKMGGRKCLGKNTLEILLITKDTLIKCKYLTTETYKQTENQSVKSNNYLEMISQTFL